MSEVARVAVAELAPLKLSRIVLMAYLAISGWRIGSAVDATNAYCSMPLPTVASGPPMTASGL